MADNGDPLPLAKPSNNKSSSTKRMATSKGHLVLQKQQKIASRARRTGKPLLPSRPPPTSYLILCLRNCTPVVIDTGKCPGLFGKRTMDWGWGRGGQLPFAPLLISCVDVPRMSVKHDDPHLAFPPSLKFCNFNLSFS